MRYRRVVLVIAFWAILSGHAIKAQNHYERFEKFDVEHYVFDIELNDVNNKIIGKAEVNLRFKKAVSDFKLDLIKKNKEGHGMQVKSIMENDLSIPYEHTAESIIIKIAKSTVGEVRKYQIVYEGVPADGLIISENIHGERTFFGDNWPDRAKNWLPTVDHPSDKATVEWVITTPSYYQSIGNGAKIEETSISKTKKLTRWRTKVPIPTKVMVIGAARFAIEYQGEIAGVPVSSWVYPQDRDNGFSDYSLASPIMDYFVSHVGNYPFEKLANVQSKTRFGGMENAGNIFYSERSVDGLGTSEALIAHEVAHQWFGNSASELNWHHIWLSEGFATYFTNLYMENKYGRDELVKMEKTQRQKVIDYARENKVPVVNPQIKDYMKLLNANSYQKGGWVLHMLRRRLGDKLFWAGIRDYYEKFKLGNALTEDLQQVMEEVSQQDLGNFFKQWVYESGHPKLNITWGVNAKKLTLQVEQTQNYTFQFPLDIAIHYTDGSVKTETVNISKKINSVEFSAIKTIDRIEIDPDTWLLFELLSLQEQ